MTRKDMAGFAPLETAGQPEKRKRPLSGFTLAEVLLAVSILAFGLCGILVTYISMHIFSDLSRDFTAVSSALQAKAEEIKRTTFSALSGLNGTTFDLGGFGAANAKGIIEVTDIEGYTDLKRVRIIACFKSRARVIGEDANLNGSLDIGEDANNNGRMDSPAEIITLIAK
ncbi:prepilin-type N-terminal cleavage/methylation domain-containing protein [bacterium]|nr:MAG: prepilin-type N-terminal cleavage/methylation domain-containing protein [bacterium]